MLHVWTAACLALTGSSMAYLAFDMPALIYLIIYYSILAIPLVLLNGEPTLLLLSRAQ